MNAQNHSNNNVINLLLVVFGKITGERWCVYPKDDKKAFLPMEKGFLLSGQMAKATEKMEKILQSIAGLQ